MSTALLNWNSKVASGSQEFGSETTSPPRSCAEARAQPGAPPGAPQPPKRPAGRQSQAEALQIRAPGSLRRGQGQPRSGSRPRRVGGCPWRPQNRKAAKPRARRERGRDRGPLRVVPNLFTQKRETRQKIIKFRNKTTFLPPPVSFLLGGRGDLPAAAPGGGWDGAACRAAERCARRGAPRLPQRRRETRAGTRGGWRGLPGRSPPAPAGSGAGAQPSAALRGAGADAGAVAVPVRLRCGGALPGCNILWK